MRFITLILLVTASCAAHLPRPVAFGFNSVQCIAVRDVVCVADEDYAAPVCVKDITAAILEVNSAIGHPVFRFAGVIVPEQIDHALSAGQLPVVGFDAAHLPSSDVLALTLPQVRINEEIGLPCIDQVAIGVSPIIAGKAGPSPFNPVYVLAHELVHALGAGHANPRGWFASRMEPSYSLELDKCFTAADIRALRSVYN